MAKAVGIDLGTTTSVVAFLEAGDIFAPEPAQRLYEHIYSAGNRQEPMLAYQAFRGRLPTVTPLLTKRGLA